MERVTARKSGNVVSVILRHDRGETRGQAVDEKVLPRPRANNSQQSRGGILLTDFVVSFYGAAGLQGRIGRKVELARGQRHEASLK